MSRTSLSGDDWDMSESSTADMSVSSTAIESSRILGDGWDISVAELNEGLGVDSTNQQWRMRDLSYKNRTLFNARRIIRSSQILIVGESDSSYGIYGALRRLGARLDKPHKRWYVKKLTTSRVRIFAQRQKGKPSCTLRGCMSRVRATFWFVKRWENFKLTRSAVYIKLPLHGRFRNYRPAGSMVPV